MQLFYIHTVVLRCVTSSEIGVVIYKVMSVTTVNFNANDFLSLNSGVDKVWCFEHLFCRTRYRSQQLQCNVHPFRSTEGKT